MNLSPSVRYLNKAVTGHFWPADACFRLSLEDSQRNDRFLKI